MFMQINNFISMFEEVDLSRDLLHLHVKYYKVYYIMNAFFCNFTYYARFVHN